MRSCRTSRVTEPRPKLRPLRIVAGALLYLGFAFVSPVALVAASLAVLLLHHAPERRDVLIAALLLGWCAAGITGAGDGFSRIAAAWVCLLGGGLVVAIAWRPPARAALETTALVAVAVAAAAAAMLVGLSALTWDELRFLAHRHFLAQTRLVLDVLGNLLLRPGAGAEAATTYETVRASLLGVVDAVSALLPALVLIQSLAALALAWALYRVLARRPLPVPLPRLRDFRFNDHLIWGIVVALVVLVVPGLGWARAAGENLATFFGALYVARGLAVVVALAASGVAGPLPWIFGLALVLLLLPLAMLGALALGVLDTWVDWRKQVEALKR